MSMFRRDVKTGVWDCSIPATDVPGLHLWVANGKSYLISKHRQSQSQSQSQENSDPNCQHHITPDKTSSSSSSSVKHISAKSFLIAQKCENFLSNTTSFNSKSALKFCRSWQKADENAAKTLLEKNARNYYSTFVCTSNCYDVCAKLDAIRQTQFGGVNSTRRGKRGKRLCDDTGSNAKFLLKVVSDEDDEDVDVNELEDENEIENENECNVNMVTPPSKDEMKLNSFMTHTPRLPDLTPRETQNTTSIPTSLFYKNQVDDDEHDEDEEDDDVDGGEASDASSASFSSADSDSDEKPFVPQNQNILRGSYSEHILHGDSLFCMENENDHEDEDEDEDEQAADAAAQQQLADKKTKKARIKPKTRTKAKTKAKKINTSTGTKVAVPKKQPRKNQFQKAKMITKSNSVQQPMPVPPPPTPPAPPHPSFGTTATLTTTGERAKRASLL